MDGHRPPYLIIIVIFSIAQVPIAKAWLAVFESVTFQWPGLDVTDPAGNPVAAQLFKLDHLKAAGTSVLISGAVLMALYKITPRQGLHIYRETLMQLRWTTVTVTAVPALSFVMNLSGQASTLGVALASTGGFLTLLSPLLGWIGVALTGSDTSSNSLFGQLQVSAANSTGWCPDDGARGGELGNRHREGLGHVNAVPPVVLGLVESGIRSGQPGRDRFVWLQCRHSRAHRAG